MAMIWNFRSLHLRKLMRKYRIIVTKFITWRRTFAITFFLVLPLSILYWYMYLKLPVWCTLDVPGNKTSRHILSWTSFFGDDDFMVPSLKQLKCPVSSCEVTDNRHFIDCVGAILLHWRDIDIDDLPKKRPGQRIFLLNFESPNLTVVSELEKLQSVVDVTISYRLDSDIVAQYGKFVPKTTQDVQDYDRATKGLGEKRLAAWMVSNCEVPSKRRLVVNQLQSMGVTIDEYGECSGIYSLPKDHRSQGYEFLSKRYKFYMALENSLCKDYITEKVFQPLYHGMIPIVYGGADYKQLLPKNSFIDVLDYPSLEALANHLKTIENNEPALASYHEWRKSFEIVEYESSNLFFCDLCASIHNPELDWKAKHRDLTAWWTEKGCFSPVVSDGILDISAMAERRSELNT